MAQTPVDKDASTHVGTGRYARDRPEGESAHQLFEAHNPAFAEFMAAQGKALPSYVVREFEDDLKCGRLENIDTATLEACGVTVEIIACIDRALVHVQHLTRRPLNWRKSDAFEVTRIRSLIRAIAAICPSTKGGVRPAATSRARSSACQSAARQSYSRTGKLADTTSSR